MCQPQQRRCCGNREHSYREKARPRRRRSERPTLTANAFGDLRCASECDLVQLAMLASCALAAPDEPSDDDIIEIDCPRGTCPGDTLEVCVPRSAGGGTLCVIVPAGVRPGESFDVKLRR